MSMTPLLCASGLAYSMCFETHIFITMAELEHFEDGVSMNRLSKRASQKSWHEIINTSEVDMETSQVGMFPL